MSGNEDTSQEQDHPKPEGVGVRLVEQGAPRDGQPQELDKRLYVQLLVFDIETPAGPRAMVQALGRKLAEKSIPSIIYEDVNDHRGLGLLIWSDDPSNFLTRVRPLLGGKRFSALTPRPGWVMFGRTYATGYEPDLADWLLERPVRTALDPRSAWSIWYPLRRKGKWATLEGDEQVAMLREHGAIGRAWGNEGLVSDVRLACYGMDAEDNDFVIGLLGKDLYPLSRVVEEMRGTGQTSEYLDKLGPFFVGRKAWQFPKEASRPGGEKTEEEPRPERKRSRGRGRGRSRSRQDSEAPAEAQEQPQEQPQAEPEAPPAEAPAAAPEPAAAPAPEPTPEPAPEPAAAPEEPTAD